MIAVTGVGRFSSLDLGPSRMAGSFAAHVAHAVAPVDVLIARKTTISRRSRTSADQPSPRGDVIGPSDQPFLRRTVQFSRVITPVEDIQVWNATSDGFSFVISFASRSGLARQTAFVRNLNPRSSP